MLYVRNRLSEVNNTSSLTINQTGVGKLSDALLKYSSINIPAALLFEKKDSINGTFALRYKS